MGLLHSDIIEKLEDHGLKIQRISHRVNGARSISIFVTLTSASVKIQQGKRIPAPKIVVKIHITTRSELRKLGNLHSG